MYFSNLVRALAWLPAIATVHGQTRCQSITPRFPKCVATCITPAAISVGCTNTVDLSCQCDPSSSEAIHAAALPCVNSACSGDIASLLSGLEVGSSLCDCINGAATAHAAAALSRAYTDDGTDDEDQYQPPAATNSAEIDRYPPLVITAPAHLEERLIAYQSSSGSSPTQKCSAQDCTQVALSSIPTCAHDCFFEYAPSVGCGALDFPCQCESVARASMTGLMMGCVLSNCWAWSIPGIIKGANEVCECAAGSSPACPELRENTRGRNWGRDIATDCASVAKTAIPTCAQPCITPLPQSVGCGPKDYECQCKEEAQASLSKLAVPCVLRSCGVFDIPSLISAGSEICACASATGMEKREVAVEDGHSGHGYSYKSSLVNGTTGLEPRCVLVTTTETGKVSTTTTCYEETGVAADPPTSTHSDSTKSEEASALADRVGLGIMASICVAVLIGAVAL